MKILVVGFGSMGKRRARLISGLSVGHIVIGVDSTHARRQEAESLGIKSYESITDAVAAENPDAAFVCTAPLSHAAIMLELLALNLPFFTELNLVDDSYHEIVELAKQKNLPIFLSSTMLYRAETQYIKEQVASFKKPVTYIYHIGQYLPDWHPWENYKNFFVGDARTSGIREILGIDLPWLVDCFGDISKIHVEKDKLSNLEIPYPDSWFITMRHQNGTKGFLAADVVSPKAVRNFEIFGDGLHLFWEGNPKSLYRYDCGTKEKVAVNTYAEVEHDTRYSDNIVENAYVDEILNFFEVLAGKSEPRWSFQKDQKLIAWMDKIENYQD